MVQLI
jgi:hypothetical protein